MLLLTKILPRMSEANQREIENGGGVRDVRKATNGDKNKMARPKGFEPLTP